MKCHHYASGQPSRLEPMDSTLNRQPGWSRVAMWLALVVLSTTLISTFCLVGPAAAVEVGGLGIRPASGTPYFNISLLPGSSIDATAIVSNSSPSPVTLPTYPVDARTWPNGAFVFTGKSETQKGVGVWVLLSKKQVVVPAGSDVEINFRLTVPATTPPGKYEGGVMIENTIVQSQNQSSGGVVTRVQVNVIQRLGVRIYLTVTGTATSTPAVIPIVKPAIVVTRQSGITTIKIDLATKNKGNLIIVEWGVKKSGGISYRAVGTIRLNSLGDATIKTKQLIPSNAIVRHRFALKQL